MTTPHSENRSTRTVRELGGEIWSELQKGDLAQRVDWRARDAVVGVVMGVLARHAGIVIENDSDLPVTPLP